MRCSARAYEDFELIISDNASTDEDGRNLPQLYQAGLPNPLLLSAAQHRRCTEPQHPPPGRPAASCSNGRLADDIYAPDLLKCCVEALDEYPDIVLAHSWTALIDQFGQGDEELSIR